MGFGLCLAGGGVKGAAHIGVLKALEENNIKVDYIGGSSSGSIVATLYAAGYTPDEIYTLFKRYCEKIKYVDLRNVFKLFFGLVITGKIMIDGLNSGKIISKLINTMCEKKNIFNISDFKMPLVISSVDMNNGDVVCFTSKKSKRSFSDRTIFIDDVNIGNAVQASCSFPLIFSPCSFGTRKLIDGGVRENVPWMEIKDLGAEKVLSVIFENQMDKTYYKNLVDVAECSFNLMCKELSKYELNGSDYILKIKTEKISLLDINKIDEMYKKGYMYGKKIIRELKILK